MNRALLTHLDSYLAERHYRLVNSVLVYQEDELVFERYYNKCTEESRHPIKSLWKSILSLCIGIGLDKGAITSLDEPILTYLPEFAQDEHPYHKKVLIRHLLTMTSGIYWNGGVHYHCPMVEQLLRSNSWGEHISQIAMADRPGSRHVYKEWDVVLLSALLAKASGMSAYAFCDAYLYRPLEIASGIWPTSRCGISYPFMKGEESSDLSARDVAKIGLLISQAGRWDGQTIVSEEYLKEGLTPSPQNKGYGFLWWLFENGYGGRGFGGQELNVYPQQKIVTVIQATPTPSNKRYHDLSAELIRA